MNDEGSIHVMEAILAGIVILSAVLFFTGITSPSPAEAQSGIDLEAVAADTLGILVDRPADCDGDDPDPPGSCTRFYDNRLEEMVDHAMQGDDEGKGFLDSVIPVGNRWLLRLDNGEEPLVLLPQESGVRTTPRAAKAAEVFLVPDWQEHVGNTPFETVSPGEEFDWSAWDIEEGPNGAVAVDGGTWDAWWNAEADPAERIPSAAPYGIWKLTDASCATAPCYISVALPDGTATDRPLYGVQLVVWPIG